MFQSASRVRLGLLVTPCGPGEPREEQKCGGDTCVGKSESRKRSHPSFRERERFGRRLKAEFVLRISRNLVVVFSEQIPTLNVKKTAVFSVARPLHLIFTYNITTNIIHMQGPLSCPVDRRIDLNKQLRSLSDHWSVLKRSPASSLLRVSAMGRICSRFGRFATEKR